MFFFFLLLFFGSLRLCFQCRFGSLSLTKSAKSAERALVRFNMVNTLRLPALMLRSIISSSSPVGVWLNSSNGPANGLDNESLRFCDADGESTSYLKNVVDVVFISLLRLLPPADTVMPRALPPPPPPFSLVDAALFSLGFRTSFLCDFFFFAFSAFSFCFWMRSFLRCKMDLASLFDLDNNSSERARLCSLGELAEPKLDMFSVADFGTTSSVCF
mmetsp:Transcript_4355/g.7421  ORF Transcript_4355/g.7421 Transcript_4355/m.7421 type:complete len:216 (+) Transcript_4355:1115-1762(+)